MKNRMALLATMLPWSSFNYLDPDRNLYIELRGLSKLSEEQKAIKNGLKKFEYPKGVVYALNQKNADKKARKQNLI